MVNLSSKPQISTVIGLLALIPSSLAEFPSDESSEHFGTGKPTGPLGFTIEKWTELLKTDINATGEYTLASAASGDWAWKIEVKADINLAESAYASSYDVTEDHPLYTTGSQITLQAPSGGIAPGWGVCVFSWVTEFDYSDGLRDHPDRDDGTCSSVLSDQCISDLRQNVTDIWKTGLGCQCAAIEKIDSCQPVPASFTQGCQASYGFMTDTCLGGQDYNSTQINNGSDGGSSFFNGTAGPGMWQDRVLIAQSYAGQAGARGEIAIYNETGSRSWPYMITWVNRDQLTFESQLTCIRATDAVGSSLVPGPNATRAEADDDTSGAPSSSRRMTCTAIMVSLVATWLMVLA